MWGIAEEDQKHKVLGLLRKRYVIAEDRQGRQTKIPYKKGQKLI